MSFWRHAVPNVIARFSHILVFFIKKGHPFRLSDASNDIFILDLINNLAKTILKETFIPSLKRREASHKISYYSLISHSWHAQDVSQ